MGLDVNVALLISQTNHLLATMSPAEYDSLARNLVECKLIAGQVLFTTKHAAQHVWFPTTALISIRSETQPDHGLEVAMVGRDGMVGIVAADPADGVDAADAFHAHRSSLCAVVKIRGAAIRIEVDHFKAACVDNPFLRQFLNRNYEGLFLQASQSAVCSHYHLLEARLARELLITQRCVGADEFYMTHELLSQTLGVRRVGITKAAMALQKRNLIRYRRGAISIIDTSGLVAAACSCYRGQS